MLVYPFSYFMSRCASTYKEKRFIIYILSGCVLGVSALGNWTNAAVSTMEKFKNRGNSGVSETVSAVCEVVQKTTLPTDKITVYGNWNIIYLATQRLSASIYSYQYPIRSVDAKIMERYFEELKVQLPKLVIIQNNKFDDKIEAFLETYNYTLIWEEDPMQEKSAKIYQYIPFLQYIELCKNTDYDFLIEVNDKGFLQHSENIEALKKLGVNPVKLEKNLDFIGLKEAGTVSEYRCFE